jgi:hypothetical protein
MKRLLFTLAIAASFIGFSSFTDQDDSVSPAALQSFKSSFKSATEVNWTVNENFYKANFSMNGQNVTAYYNTTGQMIALTRNISSLQLPITLQANLKNNYDGYWISDLVEMANDEGTSYFITLENADTKLILKSTSGSEWTNYKKQKKS